MSFVPLTQAVTSDDASEVKALLANGADVNERTAGGQTPLILATIFGHTHLISLLLAAGADPQLRDNLGLNAVDWAQRRGATEAIEVLTNKPARGNYTRTETRSQVAPVRPAPDEREAEKPKTISPEEKSQRWLAGLKQRIAEQQERIAEQNDRVAEPSPPELPEIPKIFRAHREPEPEPEREPEPQIEPQSVSLPAVQTEPQPVSSPEPLAPPAKPETKPIGKRKRCPKCNAIYHSDLVAYCAHHFVPLIDEDDAPIISEPPKGSPVLFWMIIVITLAGSIAIGSIFTALFYTTNKRPPQAAASAEGAAVQKGTPAIGPELEGKVVSLPAAECPLNGQEAIPGTVIVRVVIDHTGRVSSARASGGDWLLRGAANEAAMKSTFSAEKLRGRETEGTITYTFEP